MSKNTLTSLAILKVNIDHGRDYLEYLRPFILHVLAKHLPEPITDDVVCDLILKEFGLEIPNHVVEIVLRRIGRAPYIKRLRGIYRITGEVPDPQITARIADAERHIGSVIHDLKNFSKRTSKPIASDGAAITAVCAFLAEFDVTCLRSFLRGSAIPDPNGNHGTDIVLVSDYVQHVRQTAPVRFDSFMVLVQGHMLANALTCPDLRDAPPSFKDVTFYVDTPLLVRAIGAEGDDKRTAVIELFNIVSSLGGRIAVFSHSREELQRVIQGAANFLERSDGRSAIVLESRRQGTTRADLLLLSEKIDELLGVLNVEVEDTPRYIHEFQIDEAIFEKGLSDEVSYYNPRAIRYDINSVRSIYVLRGSTPAVSLEKARAVFVTSNDAFATAAWDYGQKHESSQNVSSVITDFSLANIAWLKTPMKTPSIPTSQLLAFSYAALEPSSELLVRYMTEIDRLERGHTISARDHQLLRGSPIVYRELMHLTLGDESALSAETVTETLERVSREITKEESEKLTVEMRDHKETRDALIRIEERNQQITISIYTRCQRNANRWAWILSASLTVLLAVGVTSGLTSGVGIPVTWSVSLGGLAAVGVMTLLNLVLGSTVRGMHQYVEEKLLRWLILRESRALGVDLTEGPSKGLEIGKAPSEGPHFVDD